MSFAIARTSERFLFRRSAQTSPSFSMRAAMLRRLNVVGPTFPVMTSSQVHGADTGAPGFARTAYAAANVAL